MNNSVPIPNKVLVFDCPFSTYFIVTFSTSKEPIAAKEHPNLRWFGFGFGSATMGHSIALALAGLVIVTVRLCDAVTLPSGSSPRADKVN